ncbi:MAG: GDSL-type esterase/lipase family protein [Bacteroidota bacterium]|nr:GDSL-type esterase/lipase family protein [Bacteroidota bacterium]
MKKTLAFSVIINLLFILFGGYVIHRKGGIDYLKMKLNPSLAQSGYSDHYNVKKSIFEIMPNDTSEIIFLGNSITEGCDWHELFGNGNIKNRGIGGDIINGVIDRIDEVVSSNPKKIFLMIGINNLGRKNTVEQILTNYEKLITTIREKSPKTKLFIQSVIPTYKRTDLLNSDIMFINTGLVTLSEKYGLTYLDIFDVLKTEKNELDPAYTFDGLHLNGKGYLKWKDAIIQYVND